MSIQASPKTGLARLKSNLSQDQVGLLQESRLLRALGMAPQVAYMDRACMGSVTCFGEADEGEGVGKT